MYFYLMFVYLLPGLFENANCIVISNDSKYSFTGSHLACFAIPNQ